MKKNLVVVIAILASSWASATELVHEFSSPAFSGDGYSSHVLSIEQLEYQRKQKLKDEQKALEEKAEREAKNTNLQKFLNNVESRIYAQLSKQLADQMFADTGATSGVFDFEGTNINWFKTDSEVTLTIVEANGNRTDITVPIGQFAF